MKRRKMGAFYVDCGVANLRNTKRVITVPKMLVDTGAESTWVPRPYSGSSGSVR